MVFSTESSYVSVMSNRDKVDNLNKMAVKSAKISDARKGKKYKKGAVGRPKKKKGDTTIPNIVGQKASSIGGNVYVVSAKRGKYKSYAGIPASQNRSKRSGTFTPSAPTGGWTGSIDPEITKLKKNTIEAYLRRQARDEIIDDYERRQPNRRRRGAANPPPAQPRQEPDNPVDANRPVPQPEQDLGEGVGVADNQRREIARGLAIAVAHNESALRRLEARAENQDTLNDEVRARLDRRPNSVVVGGRQGVPFGFQQGSMMRDLERRQRERAEQDRASVVEIGGLRGNVPTDSGSPRTFAPYPAEPRSTSLPPLPQPEGEGYRHLGSINELERQREIDRMLGRQWGDDLDANGGGEGSGGMTLRQRASSLFRRPYPQRQRGNP